MSNIYVDTIRKTGGSLGTDIRIKNTSVYESDGGTSVTQNIVQGLAKAFCHWNSTTTIANGFNISSIDDDGTGDNDLNYTNPFSNTESIITSGTENSFQSSHMCMTTIGGNTTADCTIYGVITTGANKDVGQFILVDGDLA